MDRDETMAGEVAEQVAGQPATRAGVVIERIRQAILQGDFAPMARLNEVQLSRLLGVSRTPVRAALQTLAGEGLLHYVANRGFIVKPVPLPEIVDAYEMRALAEGLVARLAAERGLPEALRETIEAALARGDAALWGDVDTETQWAVYAEVNEAFHHAIHQAAGSQLALDVIRLCQRVPQASSHNIMAFRLDDVRRRHQAHHEIYDAILCREPLKAEGLMRAHVAYVKASVVRSLSRGGARVEGDGKEAPALHRHA
ncbi:MAG TPA: GntR family transcriptional regulator [Rhodopila sp.]|jgi:GntR family transcriptional regulator of vanillate catabolism|nr:GntR family transcriptional regulator [Rhodopila sp.]